jgi:beta-glucanase (GH16 family)
MSIKVPSAMRRAFGGQVKKACACQTKGIMRSRITPFIFCPLLVFILGSTAGIAFASVQPVFEDDFRKDAEIDQAKWQEVQRPGNKAATQSGEREYYTPSALKVDRDGLHIIANRAQTWVPSLHISMQFTSGRLESKKMFLYGKFEYRAKLPAGKGFWPALWMRTPLNLPLNGEIDAVEGYGSSPFRINSTLHDWRNSVDFGHQSTGIGLKTQRMTTILNGQSTIVDSINPIRFIEAVPDFTKGYHTFAIEWRPTFVTFFLDGVPYFKTTNKIPDVPMVLVLNLAVGGTWDGPPSSATPFPSSLDVQSVRVYP